MVSVSHPGVGERGVVLLCVELQRDESGLWRDLGHKDLNALIPAHVHVLERPWQEHHAVCKRMMM